MLILGERLRILRKELNLTQEDASKGVGVSLNSYRRYECDEREPTAPILVKMAQFYNVSLDYLAGLKDERQ